MVSLLKLKLLKSEDFNHTQAQFLPTDTNDGRLALTGVFSIFGFFTILMGFAPNSGVDNAGHVGGMVTGMITGLFFIPTVRNADTIIP